MNPVPIMKLVELAKGQHTSQQTFESCKGLAEFLGKEVATSQDRPVSRATLVCSPIMPYSKLKHMFVVQCIPHVAADADLHVLLCCCSLHLLLGCCRVSL